MLSRSHFRYSGVWAILVLTAAMFCPSWAEDESPLLKKHLHFLERHLDDPDEMIRGSALSTLASYRPEDYLNRARTLLTDSSDYLQLVALGCLKGRAGKQDLAKVRQLVEQLAPKAQTEEFGSTAGLEQCALDVLLASTDRESLDFALSHVRAALESDVTPPARWLSMSSLVGTHELKQFAPLLKNAGPARRLTARWALVELGDADAIQGIKDDVRGGDENALVAVVFNRKARKAVGLDPAELKEMVRKRSFNVQQSNIRVRLLASLGEDDRLLNAIREPDSVKARDHLPFLQAAESLGDKRYLPHLDKWFDEIKEERMKVYCSEAIVKIMVRESQKRNK